MRANQLKRKLANGEACRGMWLQLPSPYSARLLARLPLDWLLIDSEHSPLDVNTMTQMVAGIAEANGPAPIIRLAEASVENTKRALDAGAYGLIAPMINTRQEAEQVVAWSRFPPQGVRSLGSPYAGLTFDLSLGEYLRAANQETLVGIQIENQAALANLDAIMSVPGLDLIFVGPVDLSISLGLEPLPENPHPLFKEALDEIIAVARKHKLPLGIYCSNGAAAKERIAQGFQFMNVTNDVNSLTRASLAELEASK